MRKIFAMMMAAIVVVGCHDDVVVDEIPTTPNSYCGKLTLSVGEQTPRAFGDDLKWQWESSDVIIGYQNAGEKSRNTLTLKAEGENSFTCEEFAYSTQEAADFHFFYANEDSETKALTAVQDGTWRPVLVGSVENTTLDEITTVIMEHLSAALEFNLYESDKDTACNIASATLTSESDFVGLWSVEENLQYAQSLSGKSIELTEVNNSRVVFNMPVGDLSEITYTLTLVTASGATVTKNVPAQDFVAGGRNRYSIAMPEPEPVTVTLPDGPNIFASIRGKNYDLIKFVANSSITSDKQLTPASGESPIYWVEEGSTIEIHTPASKFIANEDCSNMFEAVKVSAIDFNDCVDFSQTTDMSEMFYNNNTLTNLDLSCFDTSNVTNMYRMFASCPILQTVDVSSFNTENVTNMSSMFHTCTKLETLDLSGFNTEKVTTMANMFYKCEGLNTIDMSNFTIPESAISSMLTRVGYTYNSNSGNNAKIYVNQDAYNILSTQTHSGAKCEFIVRE